MPVLMILLFWPNAYFHEKNHHLVAFLLFFNCLFLFFESFFLGFLGSNLDLQLIYLFQVVAYCPNSVELFLICWWESFWGPLWAYQICKIFFSFFLKSFLIFFFCFFGNLCLVIFWWVKQSAIQISSQNLSITQKIFIFLNEMEKKPKYDICIINSTLGFRAFNKYIFS